jgi:hypothetical protein
MSEISYLVRPRYRHYFLPSIHHVGIHCCFVRCYYPTKKWENIMLLKLFLHCVEQHAENRGTALTDVSLLRMKSWSKGTTHDACCLCWFLLFPSNVYFSFLKWLYVFAFSLKGYRNVNITAVIKHASATWRMKPKKKKESSAQYYFYFSFLSLLRLPSSAQAYIECLIS